MLKKTLSIVAIAGVVLALAGPAGAAVVTTGLSIHYRADDVDNLGNPGNGSTTTLVNLANPGTHNGTIVNGTGITQNGGKIGTPYEYGVVLNDTSQTYITANTYQIAEGTNKVTAATWEFWLRADSGVTANRGALYGEFPAGATSNTRHYLRMNGIETETRFVNYDEFGGGGGGADSDSPLFDTSVFTQIAVTKSGNTVTFYNDGLPVGSTETSSEAYFGGAITQTLFGQRAGGQNESFDGQFNIIRVYDAVLTPAEILGNYNADIIPEAMMWRTDEIANWTTANWTTDGGGSYGVPLADMEMIVNSGTATVSTDVSGTPEGPAGSLEIISLTPGTTTATVEIASGGTLAVTDDVNVGDGGTLDVNGVLSMGGLNVDVGGTLAMGDDGAQIFSPATAAAGNDVTITVGAGGTLRAGNGTSSVGDLFWGDPSDTNLTLAGDTGEGTDDAATFEWSFTKDPANTIDYWEGDTTRVSGTVTLGDGVTIQLVDGGAGGAGAAAGVDVELFWAKTGITFDLAKIEILSPDGLGWTWDGLVLAEVDANSGHGFALVLEGLTPTPEPGTMMLLAMGGIGVLLRHRRRRS